MQTPNENLARFCDEVLPQLLLFEFIATLTQLKYDISALDASFSKHAETALLYSMDFAATYEYFSNLGIALSEVQRITKLWIECVHELK